MESLQYAAHVSVLLFLIYFFAQAINSSTPVRNTIGFVITSLGGFVLGWAVKAYQKDEGKRGPISKKVEEAIDITSDLADV